MKALVFHGKQNVTFEQVTAPNAGPGEVLIKVSACGICGSDLHGYLGHSARRTAHAPLIMGHEFTGTVAAIGPGSNGALGVGRRVVIQPQIACGTCRACRSGLNNICPNMAILGIERAGGFAELVSVPEDRVFALPDNITDAQAAMTETLAVEVHLFRHFVPPLARVVVVIGAGAQGLLAAQLARLSGAEQVIVADRVPERLALAAQLGATRTIQSDREDAVKIVLAGTDGWGADVVIDAVGAPSVRQQGVAMLQPGGTLALIGLGVGETELNFLPVVGRELRIQGSYCYSDDEFLRALDLIASGQVRVDAMLHEAPLESGAALFQQLIDAPAGLTKVLLAPG